MDNDLNVKGAFDALYKILSEIRTENLKPLEASGIIHTLKEIDEVCKVIY
jgi:hypothetical protein